VEDKEEDGGPPWPGFGAGAAAKIISLLLAKS